MHKAQLKTALTNVLYNYNKTNIIQRIYI